MGSIYYKNCGLILLIYDITNKKSIDRVKYWLSEIKEYCENDPKIIIIGNKIDLKDSNHTLDIEHNNNIEFINISVKENKNIDKLKQKMVNIIEDYIEKNNLLSNFDSFKLSNQASKSKKGCC